MKIVIVIFLLLAVFSVSIQADNKNVCRVTASNMSKSLEMGTGIYEIGRFSVGKFDDVTEKVFGLDNGYNSEFSVNVEVEYGDFKAAEKQRPTEIILSMKISHRGKALDRVAGRARYKGRNWGFVTIEQYVSDADLVHYFKFTCYDDPKVIQVRR
jgi:hypothetical protein